MSETQESGSELFMKYNYVETKDMCKQFLTLVSTLLVVSLTFSDKIANFATTSSIVKWFVVLAWVFLLIAIIFCGIGLVYLSLAAGDATTSKIDYEALGKRSNSFIIAAGVCFILGLVLLIATAISSLKI